MAQNGVAEEAQSHRVREIDAVSRDEIDLVARRMRETLEEVLGSERGRETYTMEWLRERVLFHLDPAASTARVYVAERADGAIVGHTILRVEREAGSAPLGLFSTTFVEPASRRLDVATSLLRRGEAWMLENGLSTAATYTSATNAKLIRLYEKHGYRVDASHGEMVRLAKRLGA